MIIIWWLYYNSWLGYTCYTACRWIQCL